MGGLSHHPVHPYTLQTVGFYLSMLFPGSLLLLLVGAWWKHLRRNAFRRPQGYRARASASFAQRFARIEE